MQNINYSEFHDYLREALQCGLVSFSTDVQLVYENFKVFRIIKRPNNEIVKVLENSDFLSYAEDISNKKRFKDYQISHYSCSCHINKNDLINLFKLQKNNKRRLIRFELQCSFGVIDISKNGHVDLWRYKTFSPEKLNFEEVMVHEAS